MKNIIEKTKTKVQDLNKKNLSNHILITIALTTSLYYLNLKLCLRMICTLNKLPF